MSLILPIEQWRSGNLLVDPTGVPYDPNAPPPLIAADEALNSAISFARENAYRIGVTVLCGLQTVDVDLGTLTTPEVLGEFESHMRTADLYGRSGFGEVPRTPQNAGYYNRVENAMMGYGKAALIPFNTSEHSNSNLAVLRTAVDNYVDSFEAMREFEAERLGPDDEVPEALKEAEATAYAGELHLTNHINWRVVANACHQAERLRRDDRVQVLIDEGITGFGVARTFRALGVSTVLHVMRQDTWPEGVISEVMDYESALSTGRIVY